jgi:hypothetical protein
MTKKKMEPFDALLRDIGRGKMTEEKAQQLEKAAAEKGITEGEGLTFLRRYRTYRTDLLIRFVAQISDPKAVSRFAGRLADCDTKVWAWMVIAAILWGEHLIDYRA